MTTLVQPNFADFNGDINAYMAAVEAFASKVSEEAEATALADGVAAIVGFTPDQEDLVALRAFHVSDAREITAGKKAIAASLEYLQQFARVGVDDVLFAAKFTPAREAKVYPEALAPWKAQIDETLFPKRELPEKLQIFNAKVKELRDADPSLTLAEARAQAKEILADDAE